MHWMEASINHDDVEDLPGFVSPATSFGSPVLGERTALTEKCMPTLFTDRDCEMTRDDREMTRYVLE